MSHSLRTVLEQKEQEAAGENNGWQLARSLHGCDQDFIDRWIRHEADGLDAELLAEEVAIAEGNVTTWDEAMQILPECPAWVRGPSQLATTTARLCWALQQNRRSGFPLSGPTLARYLCLPGETGRKRAWRILQGLIALKIIARTRTWTGADRRKKATEYRFVMEKPT